jgi:DNA-binding GntR family transcriptional regulator
MKTSTTRVGVALRELAGEGLLDLDPHRGVVVHQGGDAELRELYQVRMLLEPVAIAATVANITPAQLERAERILDQMERETDFAEWAILNQTFHGLLAEASGLEIITSILKKLRNLSSLYVASSIHRSPDRISTGNTEHRALLDACRAGDAGRAQEAELTHLRHTVEMSGERLPVPAGFTEAMSKSASP